MSEIKTKKSTLLNNDKISNKELCDRFQNLFTAAVNDVLREKGLLYQTLPPEISPLKDNMRICGIAFTVKGSKNLTLENEMEQRANMLEALHEDSICVWDTSGDDESAQWGEVMTMASVLRGCRGAVVDGGVRDTDKVLSQNFPVFCKYKTSNGMLGRFRLIDYQIPIQIKSVNIYPGDIIFGDIDGVIVIPKVMAYEVLLEAEQIKENEEEIKKMVLDGLSPKEVVKRGGYF
ncbi:RraA family protein [Gracilibacillus kekensis]|uniref:Putative 4-hydroxy-4-methyl-2-oxoglutarate aldolase n=1 Tax=Gracilibacillus kekensis TaxID=1027249 RepID=A0A1M7QT83_9BACI|nr:RraA family protein [Gracilibacillus kekensis]SHN34869.1 Regulator of RNase E activity RraA [Gracilibacillus kekensis]